MSTEEATAGVYPNIGPAEKFYGYVVGLTIDDNSEEGRSQLLATFEYDNVRTIWQVPDLDLFRLLWSHLEGNAWNCINTDQYGYNKVWIQKANGLWDVKVP